MSIGYWLFLTGSAIATSASGVYAWSLRDTDGDRAALNAALVLAASLAVYMVPCILLGYGALAETLGFLVSAAVLWFGRRWIPALATYPGRHDAEA
jgi:hypothetical protein